MSSDNFFHSPELFHIVEVSPGQAPYMVVATNEQGVVKAHLLAILRRRTSWVPPYLFTQCRIYGEGEYDDDAPKTEIFAQMLAKLTRRLRHKLCLYTEFSDISQKMFGYGLFRKNGYFPIRWLEVHNSLHSLPPTERLSPRMQHRINKAYALGVKTVEATTEEEVHQFYKLLKSFYRFKFRRLIPPENQVMTLFHSRNGSILLTTYHDRMIGGCICVFSESNAYLWYLVAKRKSYAPLHPNMMTVWHAIDWSWRHNYAHIFFLDVGLPTPNNPTRRFILSFGGKPVSKYRWFHFYLGWLNRLLSWFYRE